MKDLFKLVFMFVVVLLVVIYRDSISNFITDEIIYKGLSLIHI